MYKIAICDDDKRYRKTIREIIEHENSLPENEIRFYEYESGNELLKHTDILHELVFIDIRMPGIICGAGWKPNSIKIEKL